MTNLNAIWTWLSSISNDGWKTFAAVIQAFGVVIAAILTYRYSRKLEGQKFALRLHEIMHANIHKKRMESLERIALLMGTVISRLGEVPPFFNNMDSVPVEVIGEGTLEEKESRRIGYRMQRLNEATESLIEAAEESYIYIEPANDQRIYQFRENIRSILDQYFEELGKTAPVFRFKAMGKFKEDLQGLKEIRKSIVLDFKEQLHKT